MNDEDRRTDGVVRLPQEVGKGRLLTANARKLPNRENVYLLDTLSDLMIFFSVEGNEISILDVGRPETLEMFREAMARQGS